jgi:hypothetical protein
MAVRQKYYDAAFSFEDRSGANIFLSVREFSAPSLQKPPIFFSKRPLIARPGASNGMAYHLCFNLKTKFRGGKQKTERGALGGGGGAVHLGFGLWYLKIRTFAH